MGFLLWNQHAQVGTKGLLLYNLHVQVDTKGLLLYNLHAQVVAKGHFRRSQDMAMKIINQQSSINNRPNGVHCFCGNHQSSTNNHQSDPPQSSITCTSVGGIYFSRTTSEMVTR